MSSSHSLTEDLSSVVGKIHLGWFHRYPARFPQSALEEIIAKTIWKLGKTPCQILDPFAGTGSTLVAARQLGVKSVGIELTPLGNLIAQVRLNPPNDITSIVGIAKELSKVQPSVYDPPLPAELVQWIGKDNASILAVWLDRLAKIVDVEGKNWLQLAISSALRPSSRWLPGSIKPQVDPNRIPPPIGANLQRAVQALLRDYAFESSKVDITVPAEILKGDARCISLDDASVDAVITSPPYATMYDYFDVQRLSYLAFGWKMERSEQIGQSSQIPLDGIGFVPPPAMKSWYLEEYKGESTVNGRALRAYINSMRQHMREVKRVLKIGGVVAYAVADSSRRGRTFELVRLLSEIASETGFSDVHIEARESSMKRILPAGRDPKTGRFTSSVVPAVNEQVVYAIHK